MRESPFYQEILREGREEGRKEGRKEGREEGKRLMLRRVVAILRQLGLPVDRVLSLLHLDPNELNDIQRDLDTPEAP